MYPPGHVGLTALLFAPLVCWFRLRGRPVAASQCLHVALALSLVPDVDKLLPGLVHRGVTHTLLAAMVAGALVVVCVRPARTRSPGLGEFRPVRARTPGLGAEHPAVCYLVGAGSVVVHLVGDVITSMGIQPLFPLRRVGYSLDLVQASSPTANLALVAAGTAALLCSYGVPVRTPDPGRAEESPPVRPSSDRR